MSNTTKAKKEIRDDSSVLLMITRNVYADSNQTKKTEGEREHGNWNALFRKMKINQSTKGPR